MKKITQDEYNNYVCHSIDMLAQGLTIVSDEPDIKLTPSDVIDFMADDPDYSKAIFDASEKIASGNADEGVAEILDSYREAAEAKLKLIFEQYYIVEKHL